MSEGKVVLHLCTSKGRAKQGFEEAVKRFGSYPEAIVRHSDWSISIQGVTEAWRSIYDGTRSFSGLKIDKIWIDDMGPFWGDQHMRKLFLGVEDEPIL